MDNRYIQQFKKGSLEMILLSILSRGETYGYEIMTQLNTLGGEIFGAPREGTVYPVLYRMEDAGLIRCRLAPAPNGRSRKYYALTDLGRRTLAELQTFWRAYTRRVEDFLALAEDQEP